MKLSDLQPNEYETTGVASSKKQKSIFGRVVNTLSNIGVGVGTEIGKAGLGLGELALRGIGAVGINTKDQVQALQDIKKNVYEDPFKEQLGTTSGKFGELIGMGAVFAAPSGAIVRGQQLLSGAIPLATSFAGKIASGAGQAGARFLPEATISGSVELARTGGDFEQAKDTGIVSGVLTTALGGLGSLARAAYFPELEQSVTKALGVQGKSSAPASLKEVGQKVAGLSVLKKYAPQVKIKDVDGVESVFDPAQADFKSTVQAWEKVSDLVYQKYNKLAEMAGESATIDMTPIYNNLLKIIDEPRMGQYKKAAERLVEDMFANFPDVSRANVPNLQKYLKDLGKLTNQSFFAGISDIPTSEINAGAAKTIRDLLDDVITKSTGEQYAPLRREYAALKSIENDLVRRFKQDARKIGGGLTDYVQLLNSGELIAGLVSQNPAVLASGATRSVLGALRQMLIQPDRFLRRSFDLIDQKTADPLMLRLFGGSGAGELTPAELKLQQSLKNSLKNPSVGLSIQAVDDAGNPIQRSPNSSTKSALPNVTPSAIDNVVSQNPIPTSKAPTEDFSKGAIPTTKLASELGVSEDLVKEARKYKAVDGLSKKQDETLVAVHNTTSDKLKFSDEIGGMANPSIAVIKPETNIFENFGDITLLADKDLLFSGSAKTFGADVYSPRFPEVSTSIKDTKRMQNALRVYGLPEDLIKDTDDVYRYLNKDSDKVKIAFSEYNKNVGSREKINDIDLFIDAVADDIGVTKRIFVGFTPTGKRKYLTPITAEKVSKMMNKKETRGGESFFYGLPNMRASVTPQFKSVGAIKKAENRIVSSAEFEQIKNSYQKEMEKVMDSLVDVYKNKTDFGSYDEIGRAIGQYAAGNKSIIRDMFPDLTSAQKSDLDSFVTRLKEMPTEYFETKFSRPVSLDEFSFAVIPEDASKGTRDLLTKKGINFVEYKRGEGNQTKMIKKLAIEKGIMFGLGAFIFFESD